MALNDRRHIVVWEDRAGKQSSFVSPGEDSLDADQLFDKLSVSSDVAFVGMLMMHPWDRTRTPAADADELKSMNERFAKEAAEAEAAKVAGLRLAVENAKKAAKDAEQALKAALAAVPAAPEKAAEKA